MNKYLILHRNHNISFDDESCYLDEKKPESSSTEETVDITKSKLLRNFYESFFKSHFKNIVVLAAAGTSLDNGTNKGKTRDDLWTECSPKIEEIVQIIGSSTRIEEIKKEKDVESFLSHIILYEKLNGQIMDQKKQSLREAIEDQIKSSCQLTLSPQAPHVNFLNKITARKPSDTRVQLFTCNYDTLFEQAGNRGGFVIVDGFSFSQPREFSGRNFDYDIVYREKTRVKNEESFIPKVFHLYKLHGSLNWERNTDDSKIIERPNPTRPLIIYPASDKYESSYEQPYFEMMSRFQQALRKEDVLLIILGFGFRDKHIQNVIHEAIEQNASFQAVIVNYNGDESIDADCLDAFIEKSENKLRAKRNVTVIFDTFGGFTEKFPENKTYLQKIEQ